MRFPLVSVILKEVRIKIWDSENNEEMPQRGLKRDHMQLTMVSAFGLGVVNTHFLLLTLFLTWKQQIQLQFSWQILYILFCIPLQQQGSNLYVYMF